MALVSTGRARERVLLFGIEGCGKSFATMDVAARIADDPERRVWVIDNDNAWGRMLEGTTVDGTEVGLAEEWYWTPNARSSEGGVYESSDRWVVDGGNVIVFHCEGWEGNVAAIKEIVRRANVDDWMTLDTGSVVWANVQEYFTSKVFDASMADYFLRVRMEKQAANTLGKSLSALDGWVDWSVINPLYKDKVSRWLVNPPCNLIVITEQADVSSDDKDKETLGLYASFGVKPTGQKRLGHQMQTVIQLRRDRLDNYFATTIKDRGGREKLLNQDVTDVGFATWYLEGVGGWVEEHPTEIEEAPVVPRAKGSSKGSVKA